MTVTVGELIEKLLTLDPTLIVTLSGDPEGNRLRTIYGVGLQWYEKFEGDNEWLEGVADEDVGTEYNEDDLIRVAEIW